MTWPDAPSGKKADRLPVRAAEHNTVLPAATAGSIRDLTVITTLLDHQARPRPRSGRRT